MSINTSEPNISERFDVDDIRKIREYNADRHSKMSAKEIVEEIRKNTKSIINDMEIKKV